MRDEPIFIKLLNGQINSEHIIDTVLDTAKDQRSKDIAEKKKGTGVELSLFREDFKKCVC